MTNICVELKNNGEYIQARISDKIITLDRAKQILEFISEECKRLNCNRVLLDERSVDSREVSSPDIMNISGFVEKSGLNSINIAFWCQPKIINKDSEQLSLFTFTNKFIIKHFSEKNEAILWLKIQEDSEPNA